MMFDINNQDDEVENPSRVFINDLSFTNSKGRKCKIEDVLWSPDGSAENACFGEPYEESTSSILSDRTATTWIVRLCLTKLHAHEEVVLKLRFGVGTDEQLTQAEVGEMFDLTASFIGHIESQALVKLTKIICEYNEIHSIVSEEKKQNALLRVQEKERRRQIKKIDTPEARERKFDKCQVINDQNKRNIRRLFGWGGLRKASLKHVAESNGMSLAAFTERVNGVLQSMHRLGIWCNPPKF